MGWRISLYRLPKQTADKWKGITEEQYNTDEVWKNMYDELKSECIFYDTLTDIICEDRDKKLHSDFFINDIDTDELAFITISKEQFLSIIEEVRQRVIKWFDERKVDNDELGAPIETYKPIIIDSKAGGSFTTPTIETVTAEEMTGWLEEQGLCIDAEWSWSGLITITVWNNKERKHVYTSNANSRQEATLSAIDAALDYLANKK